MFASFSNQTDGLAAQWRAPFAIVPHDTDALPVLPEAIYVGTDGKWCCAGPTPTLR